MAAALLLTLGLCLAPLGAARHSAEHERGLAAIVAKMTAAEKAAQLDTAEADAFFPHGRFNATQVRLSLGSLGIGRLHDAYCTDPAVCNELQRAVAASSRFGIGAIFGEECTHGYQKDGHSIFPAPLSSAATFNASLLYEIGRATGSEARVHGTHECWGPILGLAREPRWGRTNEELGEDTFLAKTLGRAITEGLQQRGNLTSGLSVAALMKHYALYSVPENGLNTAPATVGRRLAMSDFLPVFCESARAGALGAMSSYNAVDGEPASASHWLLTEVLREECGFQGAVVADFGAIARLYNKLNVAADSCDATRQFLMAGGNMRGADVDDFQDCIVKLSKEGRLPQAVLDARVMDVLRVKARLGLVPLEGRPLLLTDPALMERVNNSPEHRALALQAARQAQVLLENRGSSRLPWKAGEIRSIAVIGPNGDQPRFGDYTAAERHRGGNVNMLNCVGVLEAVKLALPQARLTHVVGASVSGSAGGCGSGGYYQTIWRHHYSSHGQQGLRASYFANQDLAGEPALRRRDYAISWHWFHWGPDAKALPGTQFSARWQGTVTSDATASGGSAGFQLFVDRCTAGARLWLDGRLVLDKWEGYDAQGSWPVPWNFTAGVGVDVLLEFRKREDGDNGGELELLWDQVGGSGMQDAEAAAAGSDATLLVVGGSDETSNEGVDRASLALPGEQLELVQRVAAAARGAGKKLALLLVDNKPLAEAWVKENVEVVLESFMAGQGQGTAALEVVLGAYNPAGRLPISFPRSAAALPAYYSFQSGARSDANDYCDGGARPLWSFGHGRSFTSFHYVPGSLRLQPPCLRADGQLKVSFLLENNGTLPGDEVPQLYVRDLLSSTAMPTMQLKAYQRLHLGAGQRRSVEMSIDVAEELTVVGRDYVRRVEPGWFKVMVGAASDDVRLVGHFEVVEGEAVLAV